jgi:hypothetical protein
MLQVVGVVCFENLMVHDRMRVKGITEFSYRAMHHILVQSPFEKRGEYDADQQSS